jgi:Zn-dependent protease
MSELFNPAFIIAILIALTVHEWAHGFVADKLGDPTPRSEGRLTLNPIAHLDPLGTVMFFLVHFGWGKPVPINPRYFKHIRRDTALVAIAGPLSNLILAIIAFVLLFIIAPQFMNVPSAEDLLTVSGSGMSIQKFIAEVLANSLFINLGLMAFNLLPIAPLDGSKIVQAFVPLQYEYQYDKFLQNGPYILIALLIAERLLNIPILVTWITFIVDGVLRVMTMFV